MLTADILVPTYHPKEELEKLLEALEAQTCPARKIFLINTEKQYFPEELAGKYANVEIRHIKKREFDHGGTRDMGIRLSDADVVVCMTQDAVPADEYLIERLLKPFENPRVWASYARQIPAADCREIERYTRNFNYPAVSRLKGWENLEELGVKTFFCSNVCAAWRREKYLELGGFVKRTVFNEDMILAGRLVRGGGLIAYCAGARVIHSHNYTIMQQFHRNFDVAASQAMHPEVFGGIHSESEGIRLVKRSMAHCIKAGKPWLIFQVAAQSAGKLLGYKLGQNYRKLPRRLILWCTMNPSFWQEEEV